MNDWPPNPMTALMKEIWETCTPVYQRMGYPPMPNQQSVEDAMFLLHNRIHLLELCYARGFSLTELWRLSIPDLVATLERCQW